MKDGVLITADLHRDVWLETGRNPLDLFGNHEYYHHAFDDDDRLEQIARDAAAHVAQNRIT